MNALVLALLLASSDAPTLSPRAPLVLEAGQPAPYRGVLDTEEGFIDTERRLAKAEAKVKAYEEQAPLPVVLVAVVVAVVVTGGATAAVTYALARPKP